MGGWNRRGSSGANSVSQGDGVSDLAPTFWLCGSEGGRFRKVLCLPFCLKRAPSLDARQFTFSLHAAGAFQAATPVLELRRDESE